MQIAVRAHLFAKTDPSSRRISARAERSNFHVYVERECVRKNRSKKPLTSSRITLRENLSALARLMNGSLIELLIDAASLAAAAR